jgi:hypothetical protein
MPYKIPHKRSLVIFLSVLLALGSAYYVSAADIVREYKYTKVILSSGGDDVFGTSVAHDASGNVYYAGDTDGTADFDPSTGTDTQTAPGDGSIFVTKLDKTGAYKWTKVTQGSGSVNSPIIALDKDDNIYVAATFSDTIDVDFGSGESNITATGSLDGYLTKYNKDGELKWVKYLSSDNFSNTMALNIDSDNNVYLTGSFSGNLTIDGTAYTSADQDGYLIKYDKNGNHKWHRVVQGSGTDQTYTVVIDGSNNVYATGFFNGTADFNLGGTALTKESNGGGDAYIAKYDKDGDLDWVKTFGSTSNDVLASIKMDGKGNLYLGGYFGGSSIDLNPNSGTDNHDNVESSGSDAFIVKLDKDGNYRWGKNFGSDSNIEVGHMDINRNGDAYLVGKYLGTVDFDPSSATTSHATSTTTGYISSFDKDGGFRWVHPTDAGIATSFYAYVTYVDKTDTLYSVGTFTDETDFNPLGTGDVYVASTSDRFLALTSILDEAGSHLSFSKVQNLDENKRYTYKEKGGKKREQKATFDGEVAEDNNVTIAWKSPSNNTTVMKYNVRLRKAGKGDFEKKATVKDKYYTFLDLKDGKYEWQIEAFDGDLNKTKSKIYKFTVDTESPEAPVISKINDKTLAAKATTLWMGASKTFKIDGTFGEEGAVYIDVYNKDKSLKYVTLFCYVTDTKKPFSCTRNVDIKNVGYTLDIYAGDKAGNKSEVRTIKLN